MNNNACTCEKCQAACQNKPGWFLPGEAEKVAAHLSMPLAELFRTKLGVDWWDPDKKHEAYVFVLSPAITSMDAGEEFPAEPMGKCVFYKRGRCSIHAVKPFECGAFIHDQTHDETIARHESVADAWQPHQAQIAELLGREPEPDTSFIGPFSMFGF